MTRTSAWLNPMLDEAGVRGINVLTFFYPASMPAEEANDPILDRIAKCSPMGRTRALDWIRFGQLLRAELGWDHYPEQPTPT